MTSSSSTAGHEWDPFFGPPVRAGGPPHSWKKGEALTFSSRTPIAPPPAANIIQPRAAWTDEREQPPILPRQGSHGVEQPHYHQHEQPYYQQQPPTATTNQPYHQQLPAYQPANLSGYPPQYHQQPPYQQVAAASYGTNYPPPMYAQGYQKPVAPPAQVLHPQHNTNDDFVAETAREHSSAQDVHTETLS